MSNLNNHSLIYYISMRLFHFHCGHPVSMGMSQCNVHQRVNVKDKKRFECICIKLARCAKSERLFVQLDGLNIRLIDCTFGPCFHNSVAQANCKYLPLNGTFYLTRLNALNFHLFSHQKQKMSSKGANALAVSKCKRLQFVHVA